jgi:hypothetical protein
MKSSTKKKPVPHNEPIEVNQTQPKKPYSPPRFEVLTPDQAKARLAESGLPGEAATQQLLKAASKSGPSAKDQQRSVSDKAQVRQIKSKKLDTRN